MGESSSTDHVKRVERELAKEDSLLSNMIEQAPGMIGMAFMFVITIFIGIWLQPWFDAAGLQAFGESGSTEVRWIVLELIAIFAFTFMILWLAKNHLQHFIKYGILFVLFLALCYTTVPGAHILLVPEIETEAFEFTDFEDVEENLFAVNSDGSIITHKVIYGDDPSEHSSIVSKKSSNATSQWSVELDSYPGVPDQFAVIEGDYGYTVNNNAWIWTLDKDSGEILSKYACFEFENWDGTMVNATEIAEIGPCVSALEVIEDAEAETGQRKGALYILTATNTIVRSETFANSFIESDQMDDVEIHRNVAEWSYPQLQMNGEVLMSRQYDSDSLLVATPYGAAMIELEQSSSPYMDQGPKPANWADGCSLEWILIPETDNLISAFNVVTNPWNESQELVMSGFENGAIDAEIIDEEVDEIFEEEDRFRGGDSFQGPIAYIANFDLDAHNGDELWIADGDGIHGLFYDSLIEYVTIDLELGSDSIMFIDGYDIKTTRTSEYQDSNNNTMEMFVVESGQFNPDTMYNIYGIQWDDTAFLVGIGLAVLLMTALMIRPEWYIVNTVGVLVGAGVIVMLGVTFVPTLIVIFMVLAAVYDAWAVYRSKHMLDLADTMIGLNLPILLVAPQESGYSMLDEKDSIRPPEQQSVAPAESTAESSPKQVVKRKKPKEAMFMGLGDVIFPGMLVISCVNYISDSGLAVGISALIGGLIGYLVLMTYVASGRPQAGLPLLNGGAILGYIVGGLIFVGSAAFSFGITL
jgi:presenilin-like A22 family membrane protease|tara:strand:+ start:6985 stop:9246 length:2262 start_codon:yes stop_codon:yes gene_type:complete